MDFAKRAYDHGFRIDPIVRSLLDTDFYKLLMLQFIWEKHPNEQVCFSVTNRTKSIRLSQEIDLAELHRQLDHVRSLRFTAAELIWLRGQTFYGQEGIFKPGFVDFLRAFRLPDYRLATDGDGQIVLEFPGPWMHTTLWEIHALTIINELRYRGLMRAMPHSTLDIMYARAKVKLYDKLELLRELPGLNLTDFGTRRRHSFLWQEHCVLTACEVLGSKFTGTSNCYLAMKHGLEAKGTNAHELPMVLAALADTDEALKASQYKVLQQWQNVYNGGLLVALPDTFGTTQFLKDAPEWVRLWTGFRADSKDPFSAGYEFIDWWKSHGVDPTKKLVLFSDGLDHQLIADLHREFSDKVRVGFGWGTNLTNDFVGCVPGQPHLMKPISLVCKVANVNGRPAVKLSDNYTKATGPTDAVERYREVFGIVGMENAPVFV